MNIVVIGHVDAGKSTTTGHLIYTRHASVGPSRAQNAKKLRMQITLLYFSLTKMVYKRWTRRSHIGSLNRWCG